MIGARKTLLALSVLVALPVQAQLKQIDFTRRENQLSERSFSVQQIDLKANTRISGKRYTAARISKKKSVLQWKKAPIVLAESRPKNLIGKKTRSYPIRRFKVIKPGRHPAISIKTSRFIRPVRSGKFAKAPVFTLKSKKWSRESKRVTLSLQDMNRYVFRKEHSSRPGLPVQKAGSGRHASKKHILVR